MRELTALLVLGACASAAPAPHAAPSDPVDTVIALFDHYDVVGIPERHRDGAVHAFLRRLLADPRLVAHGVTDVVVEFGNARLQPVADRYVAGEDVPPDEVRRIWRDTGQFLVWDSPLYEQFFRTVREVNAGRPPAQRLRVVLGDPAIDWAQVRAKADYDEFGDRDGSLAGAVEREVLGRHRKALLVAGGVHLLYAREPAAPPRALSAGDLLHRRYPDQVFMFWHVDGPPAARVARGTALGATPFAPFAPQGIMVQRVVDGRKQWVPLAESDWPSVAQMTDGLLSFGPAATVDADPATYRDAAYVAELRRRAAILAEVYGMDFIPDLEAAISGR